MASIDNPLEIGGILNIGNTCYMGAAIQALANVTELSNFLMDNEERLSSKQLVNEHVQILKSILVLKQPAVPSELKKVISTITNDFTDAGQHDSEEFMQFFVDNLHETLKGILRAVSQGVTDNINSDEEAERNAGGEVAVVGGDNQVWRDALNHWKKEVLDTKEGSIIKDLFAGQFVSELRCPMCQISSKKFELFTMCQLQIPIPECVTISFKVITRGRTLACTCRVVLRLPMTTSLNKVKRIIAKKCCIDYNNILFVVLDKEGGFPMEEMSNKFNDAKPSSDSSDGDDGDEEEETDGSDEDNDEERSDPYCARLMDISLNDIGIWCFERLHKRNSEEGPGDEMICASLAERFSSELPHSDSADAELPTDIPLISIKHCLADFKSSEAIEGSRCEGCSKSPSLIKQMYFTRLPKILVISLKRFIYVPMEGRFVKQTVPVSFPLDNLDLMDFVSPDVPTGFYIHRSCYTCIGFVTHRGELNYGHYCSYVRRKGKWFFCDDSTITHAEDRDVDIRNAYIILYQKVSPPADDASAV